MKMINSILIVLTISVITILLRVGPAWLFPADKPTPKVLVYLSKVMPIAVIGMLIVYCFRETEISTYPHAAPEIIAALMTIVSYLIKRSTIISIFLGTVVYMILVQFVF